MAATKRIPLYRSYNGLWKLLDESPIFLPLDIIDGIDAIGLHLLDIGASRENIADTN